MVVGKLINVWREDLDARIAIQILGSAPHATTAGFCALVGPPNWGVYITCTVYRKEQDTNKVGTCQIQRLVLEEISVFEFTKTNAEDSGEEETDEEEAQEGLVEEWGEWEEEEDELKEFEKELDIEKV
ncbi:hypothetical protein N7486_010705 [Penicillium sp. IBT 16267x]|nr:hypothetical protein N7486_010705 [Penicillium sp. IBT 16267x]